MKPRALILRSAGTNCDVETAYAFELAGAQSEAVHINRLLQKPRILDRFQILAIPGGFSYGDDIAAGRILANQIRHHLSDAFRDFIAAAKPIIGICNGFQVLVKTDLLPGGGAKATQTASLAHNDSGRFIDRWITLVPVPSKCIWTQGLPQILELPIAHGEGKFVVADETIRESLWHEQCVALTYANSDGSVANGDAPGNPNGSTDDIAGICDSTGLVFGLMPHPERYVDPLQHPAWSRRKPLPSEGQGLKLFRNALAHARQAIGAGS